jgi:hypothetical protein
MSNSKAQAPIVGTDGQSILNHLGNVYKSGNYDNMNEQIRHVRSLGSASAKTFAFCSFMFLGVLSVMYIVAFKNYHASLEKLQHLSDMFKNPNARVASGKQGKKLMKKLADMEHSEPESDEESKPVKRTQKKLKAAKKPKTEVEYTLEKVQALLEAKQQLSTAAPATEMTNLYVPPQIMAPAPVTHYKLQAADYTPAPMIQAQPQAFIPQNVVDRPVVG